MTGLLVNIGLWKAYLKRCEFDECVDHAVVVQVMIAKTKPATLCIMHLLDGLSPSSFNLYYVKVKDMILVDYLSRHHVSDDHTTDLISISFCCFSLFLHQKCFDTFYITMRSQAKAVEVAPKVHETDKALDPHVKPEHQSKSIVQTAPTPPKRSNVQSLVKKLILKSIQCLVKKTSQPS